MVKKYVYILSFIEIFSLGFNIPMLGTQIITVGGNRFNLGIISSATCLIQFMAGPIFGSWGDSIGAKPAMLTSAYGLLLSQLVFSVPQLYFFALGRLINACFVHGQILARTLLTEHNETDQAEVQNKIRIIGAGSIMVGPVLGGYFMSLENGFFLHSTFALGLCVVYVVVCHLIPTTTKKPEASKLSKFKSKSPKTFETETKTSFPLNQIFDNLKQVDWSIFGAIFIFRFLIETAAAIYHQNLGYVFSDVFKCTPDEVGLIVSFYGISSIAVNISMGHLRKRVSNDYNFGTLGMFGAFVMIYFLPYFWTYLVFIVLFSVFKTMLEATWTDSIIEMTDEKKMGAVNGAFQSLMQLAGFIAPLINGYMVDVYGYASVIIFCCGVALAAIGTSFCLALPKIKIE